MLTPSVSRRFQNIRRSRDFSNDLRRLWFILKMPCTARFLRWMSARFYCPCKSLWYGVSPKIATKKPSPTLSCFRILNPSLASKTKIVFNCSEVSEHFRCVYFFCRTRPRAIVPLALSIIPRTVPKYLS